MKTRSTLVPIIVVAVALAAQSQGYFVIDQQSGDEKSFTEFGRLIDTAVYPWRAQSFTPAFASIEFVRLKLDAVGGDQGFPASVEVRLWSVWSGWPNAQPLAVSELVEIPKGFSQYVVFRFQNSVPLTPGNTYFIEPRQRTDLYSAQPAVFWTADFRLKYQRGMAWEDGGTARPDFDYWFQEGVIIPEPSCALLLLLGLGLLGAMPSIAIRRETRSRSGKP